MADITDPNYETVSAFCDHCGELCIFNRKDDLRQSMPIAGRSVTCPHCEKQFWIKGDRISTSYEFMIDDAKTHFAAKRFMPAVASLAQAWEVFFTACALSRLVYRPFFAVTDQHHGANELNRLHRAVHAQMAKFTWFLLRNVAMNLLITMPQPANLEQADREINALCLLGNEPSPRRIAVVTHPRHRSALDGLAQLTIGRLRNDVVHKKAYRPCASEVEPCLSEEIGVLYRVKHRLGVGDFYAHQAGLVYVEK